MMEYRWVQVAIILWWLASVGWLIETKLMPFARLAPRPAQTWMDPEDTSLTEPIVWEIGYKGRDVGEATTTVRRTAATSILSSEVHLRKLPLGAMLGESVGALPWIAKSAGLSTNDMIMSLDVSTRTELDPFGALERLESRLRIDRLGELFVIRLVRLGPTRMELLVSPGDDLPPDVAKGGELLRQELPIAADALLSDTLAPQPNMRDLRVGQVWTVQSYRPFPPNQPLRTLVAKVEREEIVPWEGDAEPMVVVTYRDASQVLTVAAGPLVELWVRRDGMVAKQRLRMGNLEIDFTRRMAPRRGP